MIKNTPISLIWNEERIFLGWFSLKVRTCFLIIYILYRSKKKVELHTHTHLKFVVGLNRFTRNTWSCDYCTFEIKHWKRQKFLIVIVIWLILFMLLCLCLLLDDKQRFKYGWVWWVNNESIISVSYLIFKFILFRFNMFLFPSKTILLQLQVILF